MAKDLENKKRKASVPESGAVKMKVKKAKVQDVSDKKRKAIDDVAVPEVKKSKIESKTIVPVIDNSAKSKPVKKAKESTQVNGSGDEAEKNGTESSKKAKSTKSEKSKLTQTKEDDEVVDEDVEEAADDEEIDDQTEALLKGWESEGDEKDSEDKDWTAGQSMPGIGKKQKKKLKHALDAGVSDKPGVVYIGRIPHGFYEHEMREYFKQFGNILKLRLSRNRKTGASKHFAFIQFESATVADIVAKTMDNYLLFGHILKVKIVPDEQVPKDLFKGANKRFKKVPWNTMEGRKLKQGASEAAWEKRVEREQDRRKLKAEKLRAIGYEFESPKIKSAKGLAKSLPATEEIKAIEAAPAQESSETAVTIESAEQVTEIISGANLSEKPKKVKRTKTVAATETLHSGPTSEVLKAELKVQKTEGGEASEVKTKVKKQKSKKAKTA